MDTIDPEEFWEFEPTPSRTLFHPLLILRDVLIVWGFTFLGGFVIGFVGTIRQIDPQQLMMVVGFANLVLGTLAFLLIGCIAPPGRWFHLFFVALFTWLTSAVNIVLIGATLQQWMLGFFAVMIMMGIGGGISCLVKKEATAETRLRLSPRDLQMTPDQCPMCGADVTSGSTRCTGCGEELSY